jgi:Fic family protein
VPQLIEELLTFVANNRSELDPLLLAGIFHKQLVLIHPFMDGNGRTIRLATKALLSDLGLDTFNLFSFENYYNQNVTKYFSSVGEYGDYYELSPTIDFTRWLEYFTDGIIHELLRVQKLLDMLVRHDDLEPYHQSILDYLSTHGRISDKEYALLTERANSTRITDFNYLLDLGLILRRSNGPTTYYVIAQK